MRILIIIVVAYLLTGLILVWRVVRANLVDQPAYIREYTVRGRLFSIDVCDLRLASFHACCMDPSGYALERSKKRGHALAAVRGSSRRWPVLVEVTGAKSRAGVQMNWRGAVRGIGAFLLFLLLYTIIGAIIGWSLFIFSIVSLFESCSIF